MKRGQVDREGVDLVRRVDAVVEMCNADLGMRCCEGGVIWAGSNAPPCPTEGECRNFSGGSKVVRGNWKGDMVPVSQE